MANLDPSRPEGPHPASAAPFVFYSSLHGRPVVDASGATIGRRDDLAVTFAETFPATSALAIRRGRLESFSLTARWRDVDAIEPAMSRLKVPVDLLVPGRWVPTEQSFWVTQVLLDRQIVDTAGGERLISWRYVQPLTHSGSGDALQLSVTRRDLGELHVMSGLSVYLAALTVLGAA